MNHREELGCGRRCARHTVDGTPRPFRLPGARPRFLPDRPVAVTHYKLEVALDLVQQRLEGTATLTCEFRRASDVVRLDAAELEVASARWADAPGIELAVEVGADEQLVVRLPSAE